MTQLNAFVARSFAPQDEERITPILEYLNTFRKAGFIWETAEAAEVESVSEKVRHMIDEREVFIGFFTRRYPVYSFASRIRAAGQILLGEVRPQLWSAPAWVLQESGYALRGGKDLILLREPGVEVFGLQGDLEYIPFELENPAGVFSKLSQMINGLLAKAAGTEVSVIVSERHERARLAVEPSVAEPKAEVPKDDVEVPDIDQLFGQMVDAAGERDLTKLYEAWNGGTDLIAKAETKIDQLAWDCLYQAYRFDAGAADGMDALRHLRAENPSRPEPIAAMARCLSHSKEFEESAGLFLEAADLQKGTQKVRSLLGAANGFRKTKQYERGKKTIELAISIATGGLREEAISVKYELVKDSGDDYFAFANAESALQENPNLPLRFSLGLDYDRRDLNELALYHFKFLYDRNKRDSSSLHNLALLYSECQLPIAAVKHYKMAFEMGETLSAANLGFMYLDCGMAEDAKTLLDQAMRIENHATRVEKCLAEIIQRGEQEEARETELLELARTNRGFLLAMGRALAAEVPAIEGRWKFPFGEMSLSLVSLVSGGLAGTAEISRKFGMLGALFGEPGDAKVARTETYILKGKLTGAVCRFELTVAEKADPRMGLAVLPLPSTKSGFMVFACDGRSAAYVELSDGKLGKAETLTKVG